MAMPTSPAARWTLIVLIALVALVVLLSLGLLLPVHHHSQLGPVIHG